MDSSLQQVIGKLETLFETFNSKFFNNELERPVIAVSPDSTGGAFGWFTTWRAWQKDGTNGFFEINVTAEHLNRPIQDVCGTLIHEMVHLYNHIKGIKDTSRGVTYHNKKFKETAEKCGLIIEHHDKYGWSTTKLQDSTKEFIETLGVIDFGLHRQKQLSLENGKKKKSSSKKYICSECGTSVRATKEVRIICADCDVEMVCASDMDSESED